MPPGLPLNPHRHPARGYSRRIGHSNLALAFPIPNGFQGAPLRQADAASRRQEASPCARDPLFPLSHASSCMQSLPARMRDGMPGHARSCDACAGSSAAPAWLFIPSVRLSIPAVTCSVLQATFSVPAAKPCYWPCGTLRADGQSPRQACGRPGRRCQIPRSGCHMPHTAGNFSRHGCGGA